MKLVVVPKNNKDLDKYINMGVKTFIFGLDGFSVNYPVLTLEEIKKIVDKYKNIEIFISINKTIFNKDLECLEKAMDELNVLPIKGVLFYDLAILSIYSRNKYNYSLVWHQTHMVTNYNTCNYYYKKKVEYGIISSEITKDEILEIKSKTKMKLFVFLLGHPIMAHSRRHLLTNYYKTLNKPYLLEDKIISEHDKNYIVKENELGTSILDGEIINGVDFINELSNAGIEYGIISTTDIEDEILDKVIPLLNAVLKGNDKTSSDEIKRLVGFNTGFFNKKTIYKVK